MKASGVRSFCGIRKLKVKGNMGQHNFFFYVTASGHACTPVHWPHPCFTVLAILGHVIQLGACSADPKGVWIFGSLRCCLVCSVMSDSLRPHSLPGSSVHGILQARILEWVAFPSPEDLPDPGTEPPSLLHRWKILYPESPVSLPLGYSLSKLLPGKLHSILHPIASVAVPYG